MKIVFATHNQGKVNELQEMFIDFSIEIVSMDDVGIYDDVVEDGKTLEENAAKKALFVADKMRRTDWVLADDSGIFIKALDGAPGVLSARWAGEGLPEEKIVAYTLARMKFVTPEERNAYFECVMVLVEPGNGKRVSFTGRVDGMLATEPRGEAHPKLPYDVIFSPDGFGGKTFAEVSSEEKNGASHRGRAVEQVQSFLIDKGILKSREE